MITVSAPLPSEFELIMKEERRRERASVDAFVAAVLDSDAEACLEAIEAVHMTMMWRRAFRTIARKAFAPSLEFQRFFLKLWIAHGDSIRGNVCNDMDLITALRILLPPYQGQAVTLFRGDSFCNRRRRTYGVAWTADLKTAETFAAGLWQTTRGGSVVLRSDAPAAAIIARIEQDDDRYEESEYLVDRRKLTDVTVVCRLPERTL